MFLLSGDQTSSPIGLCSTLGLSLLTLCLHEYRLLKIDHPHHLKTNGRIVPFFDTTFDPIYDNDLLLLNQQNGSSCTLLESYLISYSCATKPHPGKGLNVNSAPFLGYPRGKLPLFIIINLLAGDINLNPGPSPTTPVIETNPPPAPQTMQTKPNSRRGRKPKWPCGMCGYSVTKDCIHCSSCEIWFHFNCSEVSNESISYHSNHPDAIWLCPACDIVNFANLYFDSNSIFDLSNPFESLSSLEDSLALDSDSNPSSPEPPQPLTTSSPKRDNRTVPSIKLSQSGNSWKVKKVEPITLKNRDNNWTIVNKKGCSNPSSNLTSPGLKVKTQPAVSESVEINWSKERKQ